ncbi:hypothetical protein [uncultured Alsobacter sp.]|uniref:hypothetical protein n=1 Tax=uncultured Alsobacter sp. TaxID=1748258 RepID=UPI0025D8C674|nr:hypothetical protein [uncultured Alsobacter sp.]
MFKIGGAPPRRRRLALEWDRRGETRIVFPLAPSYCAVGYILHRPAARKLQPHFAVFDQLIDTRLFRDAPPGTLVLEASPFLVTESGAPSLIDHPVGPRWASTIMGRIRADLRHGMRTLALVRMLLTRARMPRRATFC